MVSASLSCSYATASPVQQLGWCFSTRLLNLLAGFQCRGPGLPCLLCVLSWHVWCAWCAAGHMCWAIQNNAKTDRNLFFDSKNLKTLAACLDPADDGRSGNSSLALTTKGCTAGGPSAVTQMTAYAGLCFRGSVTLLASSWQALAQCSWLCGSCACVVAVFSNAARCHYSTLHIVKAWTRVTAGGFCLAA